MTFKHLKFNESFTMQELEKIAKDKGLVKQEQIKKAAKKSLDLTPSEDLFSNILKLTAGLRASGFSKQATDVENKFLAYKEAAATLYETSKETGEDLVDMAHPKGSHQLEGVSGDALVETITDQKKKIEEVVNKNPTGKFATSEEIINAVKKVLGTSFLVKSAAPTQAQTTEYNLILDNVDDFLDQLSKKILQGQKNNHLGWNVADAEVEDKVKKIGQLRELITGKLKEEASKGDVSGLIVVINNLQNYWLEQIKVWDKEHKEVNGIAHNMVVTMIKKLQEITWSIQHPDFTPSHKGFDESFKQTKYVFQQKEMLPEEKKQELEPKNILNVTASEIRDVLKYFANEIRKNVLDKEEAIYKPIPDNDKDKISVLDIAFDRAENLVNQLIGLSLDIKGSVYGEKEILTKEQLNASNKKFSMFAEKSFNSKNELVDYINKIKTSIYNAIGLK